MFVLMLFLLDGIVTGQRMFFQVEAALPGERLGKGGATV